MYADPMRWRQRDTYAIPHTVPHTGRVPPSAADRRAASPEEHTHRLSAESLRIRNRATILQGLCEEQQRMIHNLIMKVDGLRHFVDHLTQFKCDHVGEPSLCETDAQAGPKALGPEHAMHSNAPAPRVTGSTGTHAAKTLKSAKRKHVSRGVTTPTELLTRISSPSPPPRPKKMHASYSRCSNVPSYVNPSKTTPSQAERHPKDQGPTGRLHTFASEKGAFDDLLQPGGRKSTTQTSPSVPSPPANRWQPSSVLFDDDVHSFSDSDLFDGM